MYDDKVLKSYNITWELTKRKQNVMGVTIRVIEARKSNKVRTTIYLVVILRRIEDNREFN